MYSPPDSKPPATDAVATGSDITAVTGDGAGAPSVSSGFAADAPVPVAVAAPAKDKTGINGPDKSTGSFAKMTKLLHGFGARRVSSTATSSAGLTDAQAGHTAKFALSLA